jgi:hypothetical protein
MIASLRYLDTFVMVDGAWLFAERRLYVDWLEEHDSDQPGGFDERLRRRGRPSRAIRERPRRHCSRRDSRKFISSGPRTSNEASLLTDEPCCVAKT